MTRRIWYSNANPDAPWCVKVDDQPTQHVAQIELRNVTILTAYNPRGFEHLEGGPKAILLVDDGSP